VKVEKIVAKETIEVDANKKILKKTGVGYGSDNTG
jgi:hypothetical protein